MQTLPYLLFALLVLPSTSHARSPEIQTALDLSQSLSREISVLLAEFERSPETLSERQSSLCYSLGELRGKNQVREMESLLQRAPETYDLGLYQAIRVMRQNLEETRDYCGNSNQKETSRFQNHSQVKQTLRALRHLNEVEIQSVIE